MSRWKKRNQVDGEGVEYWFRQDGQHMHTHWFTIRQGEGGRGKYAEAARDFDKGEAIVAYTGEAITTEERKRREAKSEGDHIMRIGSRTVDGMHSEGGGQFFNTALPWLAAQNNVIQAGAPYGTLRTSKRVNKGEEFLLDYGSEYWSSQERVRLLEALYAEWEEQQQA